MDAYPLVHLLWIVPLALLAAYIGSPRFQGTIARTRVRRVLRTALDPRHYTVLDDLTLPAGGGTVHIDLVVISRFGLFVIDTMHRRGRLKGARVQARWTEKRFGRTRQFDNPVHANFLRLQVLERLLGLPLSRFHGLIAVSGRDRLERDLPSNVVTVRQLLARIQSENRQLLEAGEADRALLRLRQLALDPSWRERGLGWKGLRAVLVFALLAGTYAVYRAELHEFAGAIQQRADQRMAPERFHPDGRPKSARELWEDGLICSYSPDTGRCACYEPGGDRADIDPGRSRELAHRGSILER